MKALTINSLANTPVLAGLSLICPPAGRTNCLFWLHGRSPHYVLHQHGIYGRFCGEIVSENCFSLTLLHPSFPYFLWRVKSSKCDASARRVAMTLHHDRRPVSAKGPAQPTRLASPSTFLTFVASNIPVHDKDSSLQRRISCLALQNTECRRGSV